MYNERTDSLEVDKHKGRSLKGTIKVRGREREDWLIQLANREGAWPKRPYECFWSKGVCPESARDDYARAISDRCHMKIGTPGPHFHRKMGTRVPIFIIF